MSRSVRAAALIAMFVSLVAVASLSAQAYGRLVVKLRDEEGNPIQGATVTVTSETITNFREVKTTSKKGQAVITFADATRVYLVQIEAEGFQSVEAPYKPEVRKADTKEIVMPRIGQTGTSGGELSGRVESRYSPSEVAFNEGVEAAQAGDFDTAGLKFAEALEKDPNLVPAHLATGGLHLERSEYDAAIASAQRALELEPENSRAYRILYDAYQGLGKVEEAAATLAILKEGDQSGDTVAMVYNEGVSAFQIGQVEEAKKYFREAMEMDPTLVPPISSLALILVSEGSYAEGIELAEKAVVLEPENASALRALYDGYSATGDVEKAEEAFAVLARVQPERLATRLYNEGVELFNRSDMDGALSRFERVIAINPNLAKAHYHLGLCYVNSGRPEEAKGHLEKFLVQAPDDPDAEAARSMLQYLEG